MEVIKLKTPQEELKQFLDMPAGITKNIKYHSQMTGRRFTESNICYKDGNIYYAVNDLVIKKGKAGSYYIKQGSKDGFTIDEKGKMKVWYNKNIFQIPFISDVFKHFNFNWFNEKLYPYVTKGIFEKMVKGTVSNNNDIVKAYFKAMHINASPSLFLKLITVSSMSKQDFLRQMSIAKDVNHLIEYYYGCATSESKDYIRNQLIHDMIQEAHILEEKIDFKWSTSRLREVHKEWTIKIMEAEVNSLDDVTLEYVDKFDRYTPEGFKLLKTQKEVFSEGKVMNHCVYTSYWESIKAGRYLAYHVTHGDEEATLGINIYNDKLVYNQCYTRYNQSISQGMALKVKEFFDHLYDQVQRDGVLKLNQPVVVEESLPW